MDARDPLFFASHDLSEYVTKISSGVKANVLLLNKADFLSFEQRSCWAEYFKESDMKTLFFSATDTSYHEMDLSKSSSNDDMKEITFNTPHIIGPHEVLSAMKGLAPCVGEDSNNNMTVIGFVGYPNVGKSSTINIFMENKRLQVSATPGKTKHYQTHVLAGGGITLVDGPGLVIPNLKMDKSEMVLSGILPIDKLTQAVPCIERLLETRNSFNQIVGHYGIMQSCLSKGFKDSKGVLGSTLYSREAQQLLSALGLMRGFMKPGGVPDETRAAKLILKDFVSGKLLFCKAPPEQDQDTFSALSEKCIETSHIAFNEVDDVSLEESFPELRMSAGAHVRGKRRGPVLVGSGNGNLLDETKKHGNRKKKEKLRRLYKDTS